MRIKQHDSNYTAADVRQIVASVKIGIIFTLLLLILVTPVNSRINDSYEQVHINNKKLEARVAEWNKRAILHHDSMNISTHPKIVKWREQLVSLDFSDEYAGLIAMNQIINEDIRYVDDYHHYHKADYWADPETTLVEGGDCEDIALVKAAVLYRFDWPSERKQLLVGYLTERGKKESHALLLVETSSGQRYILRSITNEVVHPSEIDFIPIYAINSKGTVVMKKKDVRPFSEQ